MIDVVTMVVFVMIRAIVVGHVVVTDFQTVVAVLLGLGCLVVIVLNFYDGVRSVALSEITVYVGAVTGVRGVRAVVIGAILVVGALMISLAQVVEDVAIKVRVGYFVTILLVPFRWT